MLLVEDGRIVICSLVIHMYFWFTYSTDSVTTCGGNCHERNIIKTRVYLCLSVELQ